MIKERLLWEMNKRVNKLFHIRYTFCIPAVNAVNILSNYQMTLYSSLSLFSGPVDTHVVGLDEFIAWCDDCLNLMCVSPQRLA